MSDEQVTPAAEIAPTPEAPAEEAPRTFTQEDINRIQAADRRKDREQIAALNAELEAAREKAAKLDQIEAEQLTAAEKAAKERDELAAKLAEIEQRAKVSERQALAQEIALKVAGELGVPAANAVKVAGRLAGDDAEAIEADAREVLSLLTPAPQGVPAAANDVLADDPLDKDPFLKGLTNGV